MVAGQNKTPPGGSLAPNRAVGALRRQGMSMRATWLQCGSLESEDRRCACRGDRRIAVSMQLNVDSTTSWLCSGWRRRDGESSLVMQVLVVAAQDRGHGPRARAVAEPSHGPTPGPERINPTNDSGSVLWLAAARRSDSFEARAGPSSLLASICGLGVAQRTRRTSRTGDPAFGKLIRQAA